MPLVKKKKTMKKKNSSFLFVHLLIALFLFSCSSGPEIKVVEESWPSGNEKTVRFYKEKKDQKVLVREILYYDNGKKEREGTFKNGERDGKWTYWYDNGNVWSEGEFKNGESHSLRRVYHPNGKLYYEGNFDNGKAIGIWKFYDEEGRFIKEEDQTNKQDI
jgi:antitoxin component YwqK of YwqJK toxin-antitoxin module